MVNTILKYRFAQSSTDKNMITTFLGSVATGSKPMKKQQTLNINYSSADSKIDAFLVHAETARSKQENSLAVTQPSVRQIEGRRRVLSFAFSSWPVSKPNKRQLSVRRKFKNNFEA